MWCVTSNRLVAVICKSVKLTNDCLLTADQRAPCSSHLLSLLTPNCPVCLSIQLPPAHVNTQIKKKTHKKVLRDSTEMYKRQKENRSRKVQTGPVWSCHSCVVPSPSCHGRWGSWCSLLPLEGLMLLPGRGQSFQGWSGSYFHLWNTHHTAIALVSDYYILKPFPNIAGSYRNCRDVSRIYNKLHDRSQTH